MKPSSTDVKYIYEKLNLLPQSKDDFKENLCNIKPINKADYQKTNSKKSSQFEQYRICID